MPKVALVDVDMTLVHNDTSEYNTALIDHLIEARFDQVYLVTGRNVNDCWRHVLHMGAKPQHWRRQLLISVLQHLQKRGIAVAGVSTPYDHYLLSTAGASPAPGRFNITRSGDAAEVFYLPFERRIADADDADVTLGLLLGEFSRITGGSVYVDMPGGEADKPLADALHMYLAMTDDTSKRGQLQCLLDRVVGELGAAGAVGAGAENGLEIVFFDDLSANLAAAEAVFASHAHVVRHECVLVAPHTKFTFPADTGSGSGSGDV